jgi:hypothetical protein
MVTSSTRSYNDKNRIIDCLHSINAKVNNTLRRINSDLPLDLEIFNDIRVLTAKIELLDRKSCHSCQPELELFQDEKQKN